LALVREEQGAPIQVEIEGTRYRSLAEVEDPQMKRQIVDAAQELIQFTGVLGDVDLLVSIDETESWREDLREGSQAELERAHGVPVDGQAWVQPAPAPDEVEERFLSLLSEMGQTTSTGKPTLASAIRRGMKPKPLESGPDRTFVDDIEDIVQRRILLIPALTGRGLHVQPAPDGKVVFTFEGQVYESVDKIPNLTAREVIKDAIQEWEDTA
jgi:hypothetical protein